MPCSGVTPLAIPNAIASGSARMPTLKPAHKSAVKAERLYPFKQSSNLG